MAKICSFYVSNIKNGLAYINQKYTDEEVYKTIYESIFLQFEEENQDDEVNNETKSAKH